MKKISKRTISTIALSGLMGLINSGCVRQPNIANTRNYPTPNLDRTTARYKTETMKNYNTQPTYSNSKIQKAEEDNTENCVEFLDKIIKGLEETEDKLWPKGNTYGISEKNKQYFGN